MKSTASARKWDSNAFLVDLTGSYETDKIDDNMTIAAKAEFKHLVEIVWVIKRISC